MEPVEFLPNSQELRSFFMFFRDTSPCAGIRWLKENGATITQGERLGEFLFNGHAPVPIVSPITGTLYRRFEPDGSALHRRPSQLIALLGPTLRAPSNPWADIVE